MQMDFQKLFRLHFRWTQEVKGDIHEKKFSTCWDEDIVYAIRNNGLREVPTRTKGVTTGELSRGGAWWKCDAGEDAGYLQLDEKTPEALLQLEIEFMIFMRSIVGSLWSSVFGRNGGASEIPILKIVYSNPMGKNHEEQSLVGSFGGALSS